MNPPAPPTVFVPLVPAPPPAGSVNNDEDHAHDNDHNVYYQMGENWLSGDV